MTHHTNPGQYQSSVQAPLSLGVASQYNFRVGRRTGIFQVIIFFKVRLISHKILYLFGFVRLG